MIKDEDLENLYYYQNGYNVSPFYLDWAEEEALKLPYFKESNHSVLTASIEVKIILELSGAIGEL